MSHELVAGQVACNPFGIIEFREQSQFPALGHGVGIYELAAQPLPQSGAARQSIQCIDHQIRWRHTHALPLPYRQFRQRKSFATHLTGIVTDTQHDDLLWRYRCLRHRDT